MDGDRQPSKKQLDCHFIHPPSQVRSSRVAEIGPGVRKKKPWHRYRGETAGRLTHQDLKSCREQNTPLPLFFSCYYSVYCPHDLPKGLGKESETG